MATPSNLPEESSSTTNPPCVSCFAPQGSTYTTRPDVYFTKEPSGPTFALGWSSTRGSWSSPVKVLRSANDARSDRVNLLARDSIVVRRSSSAMLESFTLQIQYLAERFSKISR